MNADWPKISFPEEFDSRAEWEARERGVLSGVLVQFQDDEMFELEFYTARRVQHELDILIGLGSSCLAISGLIIVPVIERQAVEAAIAEAIKVGYFQRFPTKRNHREDS